ncbi:MAG TPA: methylmalonyl Co-A mutase-associated GTPase MeaB [Candidatus Saccharimonadales bacterium]|nr:methylmalonyl Co-A mutase-associated GTPase MeaB [Candidatus Saccharimonadales bacterium]
MSPGSAEEIVAGLLEGRVPSIARAISLLEDGSPAARGIMKSVHPRAGRAWIAGVTGPPGAGKSTLVDGLAASIREAGSRVGILAVDPTSAFSGGAVLGDRIRMQRHTSDPGVFIRSMATRGNFGGLSRAASDAADVLDAAGFGRILMETVGVGQDEVEVVRAADTVLVVLVPGLGDDIQAIKAGLLEIADVFVLNKADREGTERLEAEIATMLSLAESEGEARRRPKIVRTVATSGQGIPELIGAIDEHRRDAEASGEAEARRRERSRWRLLDVVRERIFRWASRGTAGGSALDEVQDLVYRRELDPYEAAERILQAFAELEGRPGEKP